MTNFVGEIPPQRLDFSNCTTLPDEDIYQRLSAEGFGLLAMTHARVIVMEGVAYL